MFQKLGPKSVGHSSGAHRHPGMTGIRVLYGVRRQDADRVDAQVLEFSVRFQVHACLQRWWIVQPTFPSYLDHVRGY